MVSKSKGEIIYFKFRRYFSIQFNIEKIKKITKIKYNIFLEMLFFLVIIIILKLKDFIIQYKKL